MEQVTLPDGTLLNLPSGFGLVAPGVFRCDFPLPAVFPILSRLRLRTVVNMLDRLPPAYAAFLQEQGVDYVHVPVKGNKERDDEMQTDRVAHVLALVADERCHPLLLHCRSGKHRTGALVGCLRVLQGWQGGAVWDDYTAFAKDKAREVDRGYWEGTFDPRSVRTAAEVRAASFGPSMWPAWLPRGCLDAPPRREGRAPPPLDAAGAAATAAAVAEATQVALAGGAEAKWELQQAAFACAQGSPVCRHPSPADCAECRVQRSWEEDEPRLGSV